MCFEDVVKSCEAIEKSTIEKFKGKKFNIWKWKMDYLLVERDLTEAILHNTKPRLLSQDEWDKKN